MSSAQTTAPLDEARYRRVRRFFLGVFVHFLWWDVFLALPLLRLARRPTLDRWCRIAARFRELAVELGGVLIKLGQFLSIRFDILPPEVIAELAGLQDEVAPVAFERITARIASEFGRPATQVFRWISPDPLGSASLAQAHRAESTDGQPMVLKVLRPGIEQEDLVREVLRMRPDRILTGEARGGEIVAILQAANTGHDGQMLTIHANSTRHVVTRIETLYLSARDVPQEVIRRELADGFQLVLHLRRVSVGHQTRRIVTEIAEITGRVEGGRAVEMQVIFQDKGQGLTWTGLYPRTLLEKMEERSGLRMDFNSLVGERR
ncbi:MAG TPA: hypothetical protein EYP77_09685 [Anaerolineae bacterium]|nr:hypothetical protein [Anaerolineae bacterium]